MTPREKLVALRDALRAPMPEGFRWNYATEQDALGLAVVLGLLPVRPLSSSDGIFALSGADAQRIFWHAEREFTGKPWGYVTPTDVATVIDRVLAEGV